MSTATENAIPTWNEVRQMLKQYAVYNTVNFTNNTPINVDVNNLVEDTGTELDNAHSSKSPIQVCIWIGKSTFYDNKPIGLLTSFILKPCNKNHGNVFIPSTSVKYGIYEVILNEGIYYTDVFTCMLNLTVKSNSGSDGILNVYCATFYLQ